MDEIVQRRRGRGPTWNRDIIDWAKNRRRYGDSLGTIAKSLRSKFGEDVPESTIKSWLKDVKPDPSGEWALWRELPEPDPVVVLRVLAAVSWSTGGRVATLTNDQARWITLLDRVDPDLKQQTYVLARAFIEAAEDDHELRRLQGLVAEGAARTEWPGLEEKLEELGAFGRDIARRRAAGENPFLDGSPLREDKK